MPIGGSPFDLSAGGMPETRSTDTATLRRLVEGVESIRDRLHRPEAENKSPAEGAGLVNQGNHEADEGEGFRRDLASSTRLSDGDSCAWRHGRLGGCLQSGTALSMASSMFRAPLT
jgi:hypothetical protein